MKNVILFVAVLLIPFFSAAQSSILNEHPAVTIERMSGDSHSPFLSVTGSSLTEVLDHVFDSLTSASSIKGMNAAMYLPDGSLWKRASGLAAELPAQVPLTADHLMGMGSISKSFISVTMLLMYEEGLLDLDDSISQYLDPYPNVPSYTTIRQLLSHTSGISDYINENQTMIEDWLSYPDSIWVGDTLLYHYVLEPNFPPGTDWSYSNTNYLLAGKIIEHITGQPWYEVVRTRILAPYNLSHTFAYPWESYGNQPFSHVWLDFDGDGSVEDLQGLGFPDAGLFSLASSAGCYLSTPEDLVRFSQLVYGGDVLEDSTLLEMITDYIQGSSLEYGLGTAMYSIGTPIENHGHDGNLFYKSFALHFPSEEMSLAVQQNDDRTWVLGPDDEPFDLFFLFVALLDTYLNYTEPSAVNENELVFENLTLSPNPAGDETKVQFQLQHASDVTLQITSTNGGNLRSYSYGALPEGAHELNLDLAGLSPGLYFLRLGTGESTVVKTLMIR
jgi:D-alanyl-D-alanine carboxypeptidase